MATRLRAVVAASLCLAAGLVLGGCGPQTVAPTYPPAGATPVVATTETTAARDAVVAALAPIGIPIHEANQPYRPPEGSWFASAPRSVVELEAPTEGPVAFIVLYAFQSAADADAAAHDQARYVSSGSGRVYFPGGTRFTIRELGSVVAFFAYEPGRGDTRLPQVEQALSTLGTGVAVSG